MTRNPVILAGLCTALFAAPALAQSAGAPITASPSVEAQSAAPAATAPAKKPDAVRADRLQAQHKDAELATQQKALAAQRKDLAAQQAKLALQQKELAAQQRKLAAERQQLRLASAAHPAGCGTFLGKPRDAASCRARHQQVVLNRLGPYDKPAVPTVP